MFDLDLGLNGPLTWWRCLGLFSNDVFCVMRVEVAGWCLLATRFFLTDDISSSFNCSKKKDHLH